MTAFRLTRGREIDATAPPYGARFDGTTNDTVALQAALDAAATSGATVILPHGIAMFSNLKVSANTGLTGPADGMNATVLKRIVGSTGTAIREKTAAEGNANGATGLWIQNLLINGNSTTGNGLDIGNQVGGVQLNFNAGIENVHVRNFTTGTGMIIRGNAIQCRYLWSNLNTIGIETQGGGNAWYGLLAEHNSSRDLKLHTRGDSYYHLQVETNGSTIPVEIAGNQNSLYGVYVALGANQTVIVQQSTGLSRNSLYDVFVDDSNGAFTYTHAVYTESQTTGTGNSQYRVPYFLSTDGYPAWVYDQGTNIAMKISGLGLESQPSGSATIGASGVFASIRANHLKGGRVSTPQASLTQAATVATNASSGSYFELQITTNVNVLMGNPTNAVDGQRIIYEIRNLSGGAMGTLTWDTAFTLTGGTITVPANAARQMIEFIYNTGTSKWVEVNRSP